jgi:hypothetical protein
VCKPNDWTKTVAAGAAQVEKESLTDAKRLQLEFWTAFRSHVEEHGKSIKPTKPLPQHWMNIALGRSGFRLAAVASFWDSVAENGDGHELRAEAVIDTNDSKTHFAKLEAQKSQIESETGEPLTWHNPPTKRMCRIYVRRPATLTDRDQWPNYHAWLLQRLETLHKTFAQRVRQLDAAEALLEGTSSP